MVRDSLGGVPYLFHMNLIFRVLGVLWRYLLDRRRRDPLAPSVLTFRVLPNDLDPNWHMNNGRYLTIMDLGRFDLTLHTGLMALILRRRWMPVLGGATIEYQRSLRPFQRYTLTTRVVGWDEKWLYMEQLFESEGRRVATALVKGIVVGRAGNVPTAEVMRELGIDLPSPPFPAHLQAWIGGASALRASASSQDVP